MAGVDTGGDSGGRSKHKKKHHKKRRTGVRIDMTPMVDVAFTSHILHANNRYEKTTDSWNQPAAK